MRKFIVGLLVSAASLPAARAQSSWFPEISPGANISTSPAVFWQAGDETLRAVSNEAQSVTSAVELVRGDKPLRLVDLIALGLRRNPSALQSWEQARAAAAKLGEAKSTYYPTVTFSVQAGRNNSVNNEETQYTPTTRALNYGPQLSVTWLLLDFGSRGYGREAARYTLMASNFEFNRILQEIILKVCTAYFNLDSALVQLAAREDNLKVARATLEATDIQMKTGLATITQQLQAQQAVAQAVYDLESARASVTTAQADLAKSLGLPANTALPVEPPASEPPLEELNASVNAMIEEALARRPDIAGKFAIFRARLAGARQAERNIWPQVTGTLNLQRNYFDQTVRSGPGGSAEPDGHTDSFAGTLALSVDLFDGFLKWNKAREAKALAEAARHDLVASEIAAIADVWNNYFTYKTALKQIEAGRELLSASEKSFNATSIGYKCGLNSIVDLLTQQNNLSSAKLSYIKARTALFVSSANLAYSTGALAPPDSNDSEPIVSAMQRIVPQKGDMQ